MELKAYLCEKASEIEYKDFLCYRFKSATKPSLKATMEEVYLKSEVDRYIAELKGTIAQLEDDVAFWRSDARRRYSKGRLHDRYKRCLAMADMCSEALCYWDNVKYTFFKGEAYCFRKMNHYGKWGQIWLAIAEKFKEAK